MGSSLRRAALLVVVLLSCPVRAQDADAPSVDAGPVDDGTAPVVDDAPVGDDAGLPSSTDAPPPVDAGAPAVEDARAPLSTDAPPPIDAAPSRDDGEPLPIAPDAPRPAGGAGGPVDVEAEVARALAADERVELVPWTGVAVDTRCARDPACLSRVADEVQVRYVVFAHQTVRGPARTLVLEGFDVRLGTRASPDAVQTTREEDLVGALPAMTQSLVARLGLALDEDGTRARVLWLGLTPAPAAEDEESVVERVPWMLAGAGGVLALGLTIEVVAGALLLAAVERDQVAADAPWQHEAYVAQEQRDFYAMLALMTAAAGVGAMVFAGMAATYGVVEAL